jgi:AmiR/NasT family two-component response regulator
MTSEMAFECLFVSRDPALFGIISRILRDLSISTVICLSSERACEMLERGSADLIVIDWDMDVASELLRKIWQRKKSQKPTVLALSSSDRALPGVHVVLKKPITVESSKTSLKAAYSRMLVDHRRHARYALITSAVATRGNGQSLPITLLDIGDGGVGLTTREPLSVGDVISFRIRLPGTNRDVLIHARVLWTREYRRFGCEFLRIPPVDLITLHDWLKAKQCIKKPLNEL